MEKLEIYYGNIYVCLDNSKNISFLKEKSEIRKIGFLLKIKDGNYIDLDDIENISILDNPDLTPDEFIKSFIASEKRIITPFAVCYGNLFVKEEELIHYNIEEKQLIQKIKTI